MLFDPILKRVNHVLIFQVQVSLGSLLADIKNLTHVTIPFRAHFTIHQKIHLTYKEDLAFMVNYCQVGDQGCRGLVVSMPLYGWKENVPIIKISFRIHVNGFTRL